MTPLANILHRSTIEALVGRRTLARGEAYYREGRVEALARKATSIESRVRGTTRYLVRIWVNADGLAYSCTCGDAAKGHFCKHAIATSIAWIDRTGDAPATRLAERVGSMGKRDLVRLVLEVAKDDDIRRALEIALQDGF